MNTQTLSNLFGCKLDPFFVVIMMNEVPREEASQAKPWAPLRGTAVPHAIHNHSNKFVVFMDYEYKLGAACCIRWDGFIDDFSAIF